MNQILSLFFSFCLIGVGAYGGGLVTVPLIQHELVENHNWISQQEMGNIVAIAQMTPGPIAINAATFIGYRVGGIVGAIVANIGVVLPSILILILLTHLLDRKSESRQVKQFRQAMKAGVLALLIFAAWSYGRGVVTGPEEFLIALGAFVILVISQRRVNPIAVILASGLLGLFIF